MMAVTGRDLHLPIGDICVDSTAASGASRTATSDSSKSSGPSSASPPVSSNWKTAGTANW